MRTLRILPVAMLLLVGAATAAAAQEAPAEQVTVVMTELEPFVIDQDGQSGGFYAEIWDAVARRLGVEYEVIWVESFGELLPMVAAGDAEVAIAPLAATADREAMFDFSSAVIGSGPQLAFSDRIDHSPSLLRSLFDARVVGLFLTVLVSLLVVAHVIWLLERKRSDGDGDFHRSYLAGIWDGLWWSTVTATTVGYGDNTPKSFGGRAVALVVMLASLVLMGAFVSQVTSIMAEDLEAPAIESLDDVQGAVGVVAGSSFERFLTDQGVRTLGFPGQAELFAAAEAGDVDVLVTNPFALQIVASSIDFNPVPGVLYEEFETFGFRQGSPWREPVNQAIADLQAEGEIAEIIKDALN